MTGGAIAFHWSLAGSYFASAAAARSRCDSRPFFGASATAQSLSFKAAM